MEHKDDDDDDDDVTFAKWMSSFWGHSWMEEEERGLRDRHGSQDTSYRKASLPGPVSCYGTGESWPGWGGGVALRSFEESFGIKFSLVENQYFQIFFFYIYKNIFDHFVWSSKRPIFLLLGNDFFIFSNLRYL